MTRQKHEGPDLGRIDQAGGLPSTAEELRERFGGNRLRGPTEGTHPILPTTPFREILEQYQSTHPGRQYLYLFDGDRLRCLTSGGSSEFVSEEPPLDFEIPGSQKIHQLLKSEDAISACHFAEQAGLKIALQSREVVWRILPILDGTDPLGFWIFSPINDDLRDEDELRSLRTQIVNIVRASAPSRGAETRKLQFVRLAESSESVTTQISDPETRDALWFGRGLISDLLQADSPGELCEIFDEALSRFGDFGAFATFFRPVQTEGVETDGKTKVVYARGCNEELLRRAIERLRDDDLHHLATVARGFLHLPELPKGVVRYENLLAAGLEYVRPLETAEYASCFMAIGRIEPEDVGLLHTDHIRVLLHQFDIAAENQRRIMMLKALSLTDPVTGVANRRYLMQRLDEEVKRARRFHRSLGLAIFDLDDFKNINDQHGHQIGDRVLHEIAQLVQHSIRSIDVLCRLGGDEFVILMPEASGDECRHFCDRLRRIIADLTLLPGEGLGVQTTASLGTAIFPRDADTGLSLLHKADMALLDAKNNGRNRCVVYEPTMVIGTGRV